MIDYSIKETPSKLNKFLLLSLCIATFVLLNVKGLSKENIHPNDYPFHGPDDVMRMVQVIDWVEGANWYDVTQERLSPPKGVAMHWSRLPDIPLAVAYKLARYFVTRDRAIYFTTAVIPPLLGAIYLLAFVWACAPIIQATRMLPLAGLIGLIHMTQITGSAFVAGRVDHHNWQLILATLALGGILRVYRNSNNRAVLVTAIATSFGLWVGSEALIPLGLCCIALTFYWIRYGDQANTTLYAFASSLAITTTGLFFLAVRPDHWSTPACDAISIVSVGLTSAIALFFISLSLVSTTGLAQTLKARLALSTISAGLFIGLLFLLFPNCQHGPYSGLSSEWKQLLPNISEARNIISVLKWTPQFAASYFSLPIAAIALNMYMVFMDREPGARETWFVLGLFTVGATTVALWQLRGGTLANGFAGFSFTWLAITLGAKFLGGARSYKNLLQSILPIIIVGLLPTIATYLTLLATWQEKPESKCDWVEAAKNLSAKTTPNSPPLLIAALGNHPEFLLLTNDLLLGAYYHRDKDGLADTLTIFNGKVEDAKPVILRRGVDVLFICKDPATNEDASEPEGPQSFKDQLSHGKLPAWIEKIYEKDDLVGFLIHRNF